MVSLPPLVGVMEDAIFGSCFVFSRRCSVVGVELFTKMMYE